MSIVYLLHFDKRINPNHPCQHYIGYAKTLKTRMAEHKAGSGARLTQVAKERGIDFVVARTWKGGRKLERQLKNQKNAPRLCPICRGENDQHHPSHSN